MDDEPNETAPSLSKIMQVEIKEEPLSNLDALASISIAFEYDRVLMLAEQRDDQHGIALEEVALQSKRGKNYDSINGENHGPATWRRRFDTSGWALFAARVNGTLIGGAVVAFNSPELHMLENRKDLAVLWDIRVDPSHRGGQVGTKLFKAAATWAKAKGCSQLKIETQNINVAACKFYSSQGCVLGGINRFAYQDLPDEIQLLWYKDLL